MDKALSPSTSPRATSATDYAVTHPLRPLALAGWMTLVAFSVAAFAVFQLVAPYVEVIALWTWTGATVLFIMIWSTIMIIMAVRRPSPEEAVRLWGWLARFIVLASQGIVIWAIWVLLTPCPDPVRFALTGMFLINSPSQIIATPENVLTNRIGLFGSYGSVALWWLLNGDSGGIAISAFAAGCGVMLFVLADVIPKTVAQTVAGRMASDEAVARLEAALAEVAAERDAKTRFIAAASHDLGQPLQAANLFFGQMERARDPAQRTNAADGVRRAFESAEQLLSHMLNHLRLEADAVEPHISQQSASDALVRAASLHRAAATDAGVEIRVVPSTIGLLADPVLLDRALGNLVDNAIGHSGARRILLGARRLGQERMRLWVIDDGVGIQASEVPRLFEDYFRGSNSRAATKGGFGLGLSSVKRIAQLMHGEAALDTRWRNGAAFYLEFPLQTLPKKRGTKR